MSASLQLLLVGYVVVGAAFFYYGFVFAGPIPWRHQLQTGFLVYLLLLVPLLLFTLQQQHRYPQELAGLGVVPYPDIVEVIGMPITPGTVSDLERQRILDGDAVQRGTRHAWVFKIQGAPEAALAYYREPSNTPGWDLAEDSGIMLVFTRGAERLAISVSKGWNDNRMIITSY